MMPVVGLPDGSRLARQNCIWGLLAILLKTAGMFAASALVPMKSAFMASNWDFTAASEIFSAVVLYTTWNTIGIVMTALLALRLFLFVATHSRNCTLYCCIAVSNSGFCCFMYSRCSIVAQAGRFSICACMLVLIARRASCNFLIIVL